MCTWPGSRGHWAPRADPSSPRAKTSPPETTFPPEQGWAARSTDTQACTAEATLCRGHWSRQAGPSPLGSRTPPTELTPLEIQSVQFRARNPRPALPRQPCAGLHGTWNSSYATEAYSDISRDAQAGRIPQVGDKRISRAQKGMVLGEKGRRRTPPEGVRRKPEKVQRRISNGLDKQTPRQEELVKQSVHRQAESVQPMKG